MDEDECQAIQKWESYRFGAILLRHVLPFHLSSVIHIMLDGRVELPSLSYEDSTSPFMFIEQFPPSKLMCSFDFVAVCTSHFTLVNLCLNRLYRITVSDHSADVFGFIEQMIEFQYYRIRIPTIYTRMSFKVRKNERFALSALNLLSARIAVLRRDDFW